MADHRPSHIPSVAKGPAVTLREHPGRKGARTPAARDDLDGTDGEFPDPNVAALRLQRTGSNPADQRSSANVVDFRVQGAAPNTPGTNQRIQRVRRRRCGCASARCSPGGASAHGFTDEFRPISAVEDLGRRQNYCCRSARLRRKGDRDPTARPRGSLSRLAPTRDPRVALGEYSGARRSHARRWERPS